MQDSSYSLLRIIDDILDMAKLDAELEPKAAESHSCHGLKALS